MTADMRVADLFLTHKVYTHLGYRPTGQTRELHDISQTTELEFEMTLD
jgi:hypothetical protein